jgi:RHS repeat-associated protein
VSCRLRVLLACAVLAPLARPAAAAPTRKHLAPPSSTAPRRQDLAPLFVEVERRDRELRAEFDAAGARSLPPKARQRLEETRRAWTQGQGRLVGILRALRAADVSAGATALRGVAEGAGEDEALELLRKIRAASRAEPISEGELKTRIPDLRPPALAGASLTQVTSGDEPPIGTIAPEIRLGAASFSGPIEVYEWVRNAIRPELYHGVMKGPVQTLLDSSGNDADTAGLLIALLRAKGVPARYVRGTVDLPAPLAVAVTGTGSAERALRAFRRAGVPAEPLSGPGGVAAIRAERVWAEAYVPYANYRGAALDSFEKAWVPLDPGLKRLDGPGGYDVRSAGFDPARAFEDYLAAVPGATPVEFYRERAKAALALLRPDTSYEQALARRDVIAQRLGLLPSTLPYTVLTRAEVGYAPPEPIVHTARFLVEADGRPLLDASFALPALLGRRLTLSYVPFEADDEEVVRQYGGLFSTPPYLVEVLPVLKLGGIVLARGAGGVGLGVKVDFRIELGLPGGSDEVRNRVVAGNLTAIGLAAGQVTAEEGDDEAAQLLARLAFHYLDRWNRADEELAALLRVVPIRPSVSACLVQSAVEVEYAGGDPLYPVRYDWRGLAIDADRRPSAPVGIESDAAERDFLLASSLEGSVLEHRLFEEDLAIASVSTAKALQLAVQGGIEVLDLGPENAESALPELPLDDGVKDEIRAGVAQGYRVRVPAAPLTLQAWTGTGYLILDVETGEAAWQLQGGHSGGVTAPAVTEIPANVVDVVWRQAETPAPQPGSVAFLQKFDTTDFQTGTVDEPLSKPFKVLVTDESGSPVPGAPVTFSVIGGGGTLVDPATDRASASEITVLSCVGGEKEEPCASLKAGEATAVLRLGRTTGEIPRYVCEEPYTCTCPEVGECNREEVGYTTRVGMNLVTARSGDVDLAEPFTTFGFPEKRPADGRPGVFWAYVGLAAPPVLNPVNLTVVDRMALFARDRHGNPLSNVLMSVSFEGVPVLGPPPKGWSLYRGVTETPGHVLRAEDYVRCSKEAPSVIWGQCPGEALAVQMASSSLGAFAYPVVGDSPWSYYKFNYGTKLDPGVGWVEYHTDGLACPAERPGDCAAFDSPQTLTWQGTRPVVANLQGNVVEAYPPGATAEVGVWADVVYEEAQVSRSVDGKGREHFGATGTNVWRRERLSDSEIRLRPLSPGTGVSATAAPLGEGRYTASMTLAADPRQNAVEIAGRHYLPLVKYLHGDGSDVDPATIDLATMTLTRVKDRSRPVQIVDRFSLWGIEPKITKLEPSPLFLSAGGLVTRAATVSHEVAPPEYRSLLEPGDLQFAVHAAASDAVVLSASGSGASPFTIPAGLSLDSGQYYARLSVRGVSGHRADGGEASDVPSAAYPVPICSLLDLLTPQVEVTVTRDPLNDQLCSSGDRNRIRFNLCRGARVTLRVAGSTFTASLDGGAPRDLADIDLGPGIHEVVVPAGLPELESDQVKPFTLEARDTVDPTQATVAAGVIAINLISRSVLPVGHTFVKGVDLLDGHLVQQSTDLKVPGRHLGLEVTRTYSSAGWSSQGPLGGGWSLNYGSGLFVDGGCGLATVVTPDGGSQVFRSTNGLVSFTPQKGYHTRLEREGNVYLFTDKAGNVHHFESPDPEGRQRLDFIREPHGDRLVFTYDGASRLTKVAEVHPEAGEVRAATFAYQPVYGEDRIVRAEIAGLGLAVDYEYDTRGNLTKATRKGQNLPGAEIAATEPLVEGYRYLTMPAVAQGRPSAGDLRKEHQLVETTDPNGHRREYVYYAEADAIPGLADGSAAGLFLEGKWELVKQVLEHPDPGLTLRTEFRYDLTHWPSSEWWTTVRDGRGKDTLYVLNGNGSPLRIEEPLGKTTRMTWPPDDILKTREQDANGRVTEFAYDARGNLTQERVLASDPGPAVTEYRYDERFNKLTYKKDAEGRETSYAIDPASGDLLATVDAVLNRTSYAYDDHGRLLSATDPRRHVTLHRGHDSFGNPTEVEDPLGNVTTRSFDLRGRLTRQSDTVGHETRQAWDGLDRLVRTTRVAGGASDDEVTETGYYPGGEVRLVRNPNGAETTSTIDGLNRVVRTDARLDGTVLTTAATWDANGNKETETDRRGVTRHFAYDDLNRLKSVEIVSGLPGEGPTGTIAEYGYDLVGNKTSETNLAGLTTRFEHDGLYRVKAKILPQADTATGEPYREEYAYDLVGNLRSQKDANRNETAWEYDGLNRRIRTTNALGQVTTETYLDLDDPPQSPPSRVNKSEEHDQFRGLRTTFHHDALNREAQRTQRLEGEGGGGVAYTTSTAYDDRSHAVTVTDARGHVTATRLNGLDRPVEQTVDPGGLGLVTRTSYDGLGNRKSVTDANGHATLFRHDGLGRLVETTDAAQQRTVAAYDGEGLKIAETDRRGISRVFTHDNLGRLRREALAAASIASLGWSRETRYGDKERQRIEVDARGLATTLDLDGLDRVVREADALGHFRTFRWDGVNKREETDKRPSHHKTAFDYDAVNRLTKTTDPAPFDGQTVVITYEDAQNRVTEKDRRGSLKVTQLDPAGRVVNVTRAAGTPDEAAVERNTWDGNGNREATTDGEGRVTRFAYDAANRLESRTDGFATPDAATTTFRYDGVGNLLEERDARAALLGEPWSSKRTWDALNRLETETNGEGDVTTYGYDNEGNRTSVKAPMGQVTTFEYDEVGKLTRVIQPPPNPSLDPTPLKTEYVYDENRNRVLQTDASLHSVKMEYDELNRLKRTTQDPGGLSLVTETVKFDENGNPEIVKDPKGQTTTSTFDELNRLKSKSFAFALGDAIRPWRYTASIDYAYDENGNLRATEEHVASGDDPPGPPLTTTRAFDRFDRLTSETQPLPDGGSATVKYSYFKNGARQSVTDPAGAVTRYAYDGQNRLQSATTDFGTTNARPTTYGYWPDDLLRTVTYPNGVVATHGYDKADRVVSITNARGATPISSYQYSGLHPATGLPVSYDANGNRLIQVETNGGATETTTYGYDGLDRLGSIDYPSDAAYPHGRLVSYAYDAVGNRIRETERDSAGVVLADQQGVFDNANRLTELADLVAPAHSTTFAWDPNGNQTTKTVGTGDNAVTTTYVYDLRDKLVEVVQGTSTLGRFQYDSEGRRTKKIGEEGLRQYVYDQTSLLAEYDATGLPKAKYDYGSDRLISLTRADEGRRYFSLDALRSVVNLTDDSGAAVASYHLDAWGNFRLPTELTASANRFAFTGHVFDTETGLYNAKARYFDPKLGRFLTQDSFLGTQDNPPSLHRYVYGYANPVRYVDSSGHWPVRQEIAWFASKSAETFAGYAVGVGKLAAAPVTFVYSTTYNVTGGIAYAATGRQEFRAQYEALDRVHQNLESVEKPSDLWSLAQDTVLAPVHRIAEGFNRGDAYAIGEGTGSIVGQTAMLAAGSGAAASRLPTIGGPNAFATAEGVVQQGGGALARAGGGSVSVPVGTFLASKANDAGTLKESADGEAAAAKTDGKPVFESTVPKPPSTPKRPSGVPDDGFVPNPAAGPYKRATETTAAQRASVQGKPCVDCGTIAPRQVADHIDPEVVQHYREGKVDVEAQRSPDAVQPHCPTCSAKQGGWLSQFGRRMKELLGL